MKLADIWNSHVAYTKEFSTTTRQLAFASIAVCWVLKPQNIEILTLTPLVWAIIFAVVYFISDCLQYASGALVHYRLAKKCEAQQLDSIPKSPRLDIFPYLFLTLKGIALIVSYIAIGFYLF
ncbi:hypothetical protein CC99x_007845 [Candidatus Berkiella cookevillensis]|uniref:Uncharacterized protein n=1 Tax=Candidatus Berkiella cookevillensis TaxID=437022 RepID=A0A0Q9YJF4_9GAMM|nr:hypothetical protein [Candidatus Berkiella cookevillensis]MCS5708815.1 hypothetical protein [Candidatus Berkiella cookevillensis]